MNTTGRVSQSETIEIKCRLSFLISIKWCHVRSLFFSASLLLLSLLFVFLYVKHEFHCYKVGPIGSGCPNHPLSSMPEVAPHTPPIDEVVVFKIAWLIKVTNGTDSPEHFTESTNAWWIKTAWLKDYGVPQCEVKNYNAISKNGNLAMVSKVMNLLGNNMA